MLQRNELQRLMSARLVERSPGDPTPGVFEARVVRGHPGGPEPPAMTTLATEVGSSSAVPSRRSDRRRAPLQVGSRAGSCALMWTDVGVVAGCAVLALVLGAATLRRRTS